MEPLDEQYLEWLYSQVGLRKRGRKPVDSHWHLLQQLYTKEFVWIIPNDDNRLEDGRDLRLEFVRDTLIYEPNPEWWSIGCSMLEMLIALARRLEFETDIPTDKWFWKMLQNLGLLDYTDERQAGGGYSEGDVDAILDDVIWRTYEPDGRGGLFPLEDAQEDQRNVELWYQQSAYVIENNNSLGV